MEKGTVCHPWYNTDHSYRHEEEEEEEEEDDDEVSQYS